MVPRFNEGFHPDPNMINLYYTYLVLGVIVLFLSWMVPVTIVASYFLSVNQAIILTTSLFIPLIAAVFFVVYWIQKYYSSIKYKLAENEVVVEKVVYWKRRSFVPYNRITNIDTVQSPLARHFRLGTVRIQTAEFSTGSSGTRIAEAVILNIKNFEELKDIILNFVRRRRPVAIEAEAEEVGIPKSLDEEILGELRKVREILEKE